MSSVNWIFLKCFYLGSTGKMRIQMGFKWTFLLPQLLEHRGENAHGKCMCAHTCVCLQNPQVPVPLLQVASCKTIAWSFQSRFDAYFKTFYPCFTSDDNSCLCWRVATVLASLGRILKSYGEVLALCRNGVTVPCAFTLSALINDTDFWMCFSALTVV